MTAESSESGNRLFIILAIALIGLICIGLMGLGGAFFVIQSNRAQEAAALTPSPSSTPFPPTFTPTPTPTFTPTDTPEPTATSTPVIKTSETTEEDLQAQADTTNEATPESAVTVAPSPEDQTGEPTDSTPALTATPEVVPGSGGVLSQSSRVPLAWAGGVLLISLVVYGGMYWRRSSTSGSG